MVLVPYVLTAACNLTSLVKKSTDSFVVKMAENAEEIHAIAIDQIVIVPEGTLLRVLYRGVLRMVIAEKGSLHGFGEQRSCTLCRYSFGGGHLFVLGSQNEPEILGSFEEFIVQPDRSIIHEVMMNHNIYHPCDLVKARTIDSVLTHEKQPTKRVCPKTIKKTMRNILSLDQFVNAAVMYGY